MNVKLTDRFVRGCAVPDTGYRVHWDSDQSGFGLRITARGTRSFILNYRNDRGRERRITIGTYPDWSVQAAREEAKRLRRDVDRGSDPMAERHEIRTAETVGDLAQRYLAEHAIAKRASSRLNDERLIKRYVLPKLGKLRVVDVRHDDIATLHRAMRNRPYQANRLAALLGKMFALAERWELRSDNPARGISRYQEEKRHRYLTGDELKRLINALEDTPNQKLANAIRLLLLTGARKSEVLGARWEQFDLDRGVWIKPSAHTKQKREHRVPLSAPALQLLSNMRASAPDNAEHLFPSRLAAQPVSEIKKFWQEICEKASIVDCRVHDLRHTYASILASAGLSLPIIGALLGHTQASTTHRYAHLFDDPLREATERVGSFLDGVTTDNDAEVQPMHIPASGSGPR